MEVRLSMIIAVAVVEVVVVLVVVVILILLSVILQALPLSSAILRIGSIAITVVENN